MVLHELHILQRPARSVDQRHAVARLDRGVRGIGKDAAAASGTDHYGLGGDGLNAAGH